MTHAPCAGRITGDPPTATGRVRSVYEFVHVLIKGLIRNGIHD